uniref:UMOD/GP2/OIT3-like D8C domain-containing protein n=1 Tax=Sinocyclocheilus anshuiensis TaxID=1608454 RepID=A0A671KCQ9_9TELE
MVGFKCLQLNLWINLITICVFQKHVNFVNYIFLTAYLSVDPCYNYTVLDNPWRAISNTHASVLNCDKYVTWSGWYRPFINGLSAYIPQTCVARYSCGTDIALWIHGGHPTVEDGVVTRDVCGNFYCCYFGSYPIKVKACPGNYYVYELVRPTICRAAYCAGDYIYMSSFYKFMIFQHQFNSHTRDELSW